MTTKTTVKERVYDEQIHPLMNQITGLCQEHGISMLAAFDISGPEQEALICSTQLPDETGKLSKHLYSRRFTEGQMTVASDRPNPGWKGSTPIA